MHPDYFFRLAHHGGAAASATNIHGTVHTWLAHNFGLSQGAGTAVIIFLFLAVLIAGIGGLVKAVFRTA